MKKIVVTGAAGQIAYSLLFRIANGDIFGFQEPISLSLCDLPGSERAMEGVAMELADCAFPLLREVTIHTDPFSGFKGVDLALLVGAKPRSPGMERADLLNDNGKIFVEQGRALNEVASKEVRVLVIGNPCNTNCLIAMHYAPKIPRENFHALMRLDQNRATALLATQAKKLVSEVKNVIIWGNHSATQVPDYSHAHMQGKRVTDFIKDEKWLKGEFIELIQKRGAAILNARGKSSAASAANAIIDAIRALYTPTLPGEWFTTAVITDHNAYGIEKNLVFGFPCRSKGEGDWEIVEGLEWNSFIKEKIEKTTGELLEERKCIEQLLKRK